MAMATYSNRAPPTMNLEKQPYTMWKKDIQIWQVLTSMPKNKHGLDVYMSLDAKYKAFVNLKIEELPLTNCNLLHGKKIRETRIMLSNIYITSTIFKLFSKGIPFCKIGSDSSSG